MPSIASLNRAKPVSAILEQDVSISILCNLMSARAIAHEVEDDGTIFTTEGLPLWVSLDTHAKLIIFSTYYPATPPEADHPTLLEIVNTLSSSVVLVQFSWERPNLVGQYWMPYDTCLLPAQFIRMLRHFSSAFYDGAREFQKRTTS